MQGTHCLFAHASHITHDAAPGSSVTNGFTRENDYTGGGVTLTLVAMPREPVEVAQDRRRATRQTEPEAGTGNLPRPSYLGLKTKVYQDSVKTAECG